MHGNVGLLPFQRAAIAELQAARAITRAWQALIPPSAVATRTTPRGVEYLHPTKGWRKVSRRRFALNV